MDTAMCRYVGEVGNNPFSMRICNTSWQRQDITSNFWKSDDEKEY
jgi:hypothetical protein